MLELLSDLWGFMRERKKYWLAPIIFVLVATVMEMIAEGVARTFVQFEPLEAYRWDITGSIIGMTLVISCWFGSIHSTCPPPAPARGS